MQRVLRYFCFILVFSLFASIQGKSILVKVAQLQKNSPKKSRIPTIISGPLPECMPIPWQIVDPCHEHQCENGEHALVSVCDTKGITCGEGEYLKVPSNPKTASECCECAPFARHMQL